MSIRKKEFIEMLRKICIVPGISGHEYFSGISKTIFEIARDITKNTVIDKFGNVISLVGNGPKKIILDAHLDEIGFIVSKIDKEIWLSPIGDVKNELIDKSSVYILVSGIRGVISSKNEKIFFLPLNKDDKKKIIAGDIVSFERKFKVEKNEVYATALDNRIGCAVLLELMKIFTKGNPSNFSLICSFSTQEEKGSSTLNKIADKYKPEFGIVIDAAYAKPVDFDDRDMSIPELGKGCAIQYQGKDFIVTSEVVNEIKNIARKNRISTQKEIPSPNLGRTNFPQLHKSGVVTGVINIPVAMQHRQESITNIDDAVCAVDLIKYLLQEKFGKK
jgi:endoglucanase